MSKILVCGGRDYVDYQMVGVVLGSVTNSTSIVVHGGAKGADTLVGVWARDNEIEERVYPADWKSHGRAAGPIRNLKMLKHEYPDLVIAFPGGRGTEHMIKSARNFQTPVLRVEV